MRLDTKLRIAGSILEIGGFFIVLHIDILCGLLVHITALAISLPYYVKTRSWDVVLLLGFILITSTSKSMALSSA